MLKQNIKKLGNYAKIALAIAVSSVIFFGGFAYLGGNAKGEEKNSENFVYLDMETDTQVSETAGWILDNDVWRSANETANSKASLKGSFVVPAENIGRLNFNWKIEQDTSGYFNYFVRNENGEVLAWDELPNYKYNEETEETEAIIAETRSSIMLESGEYTIEFVHTKGRDEPFGSCEVSDIQLETVAITCKDIELESTGEYPWTKVTDENSQWYGWWGSGNKCVASSESVLKGASSFNVENENTYLVSYVAMSKGNEDVFNVILNNNTGEGVNEYNTVLYVGARWSKISESENNELSYVYTKDDRANSHDDTAYVKDNVRLITLGEEKTTQEITMVSEKIVNGLGWDYDENKKLYTSNNTGVHGTTATMQKDFSVDTCADLSFSWTVGSEEWSDRLSYKLIKIEENTEKVLRQEEMSDFDISSTAYTHLDWQDITLHLDEGTYRLVFSYSKDEVSGTYMPDKGFVKNIKLTTYMSKTEIPSYIFATVDQLKTEFGTAKSDKPGKIQFGKYGQDGYYYLDVSSYENSERSFIGKDSPINWLITGRENDGNVVLYSEKPLIGCSELTETSDSKFILIDGEENFLPTQPNGDSSEYTYEEEIGKTTVKYNDYRASNLRQQLARLVVDTDYFSGLQQAYMLPSIVNTCCYNGDENCEIESYATEDKLYPAGIKDDFLCAHSVYVGEQNNLEVDQVNWGGITWLRWPYPYFNNTALVTMPGFYVDNTFEVLDSQPAVSAAFKLDMSNILFASAVGAKESNAYLSEPKEIVPKGESAFKYISSDSPMVLRFAGTNLGTLVQTTDASAVTATGAAGSTLIIQGIAENGQNWYYSAEIPNGDEFTVNFEDVVNAGATWLTSLENTKVWLEKAEDGIISATKVVDVFAMPATIMPPEAPKNTQTLAMPESDETSNTALNAEETPNPEELPEADLLVYATGPDDGESTAELKAVNTDVDGVGSSVVKENKTENGQTQGDGNETAGTPSEEPESGNTENLGSTNDTPTGFNMIMLVVIVGVLISGTVVAVTHSCKKKKK